MQLSIARQAIYLLPAGEAEATFGRSGQIDL